VSEPVWKWVAEQVVLAIHDAQIAEHGGGVGVRDLSLVQSALGRPQNLAAYGSPDAADLAAAYAFGIARNHGFVDGNKRTAFVVAVVFLLDHGYELTASDAEAVTVMLAVASGEMDEGALAVWLRLNLQETENV
jgi:death-on-curing protein